MEPKNTAPSGAQVDPNEAVDEHQMCPRHIVGHRADLMEVAVAEAPQILSDDDAAAEKLLMQVADVAAADFVVADPDALEDLVVEASGLQIDAVVPDDRSEDHHTGARNLVWLMVADAEDQMSKDAVAAVSLQVHLEVADVPVEDLEVQLAGVADETVDLSDASSGLGHLAEVTVGREGLADVGIEC